MVCKNCGNQLPDDALFCNNCGTRINQAGQGQYNTPSGQYSPPPQPNQPGAYYQPQSQYTMQGAPNTGTAMPPKNNTTKVLLIALAGVVVVTAAVLVIVLAKPFSSSNNTVINASLPSSNQYESSSNDDVFVPDDDSYVLDSDTVAGDLDVTETPVNDIQDNSGQADAGVVPSQPGGQLASSPSPSPSPSVADSGQSLMIFDTPTWSTDPIYYVIEEGGVWTSVGLATNPNQCDGEDGVFSLSDFEGCTYYIEFFNDLTWNIKYDEYGDVGVETAWYEIMDTEYADIYAYDDTFGFRFYNGSDGRLYMCLYQIDGELYPDSSDFLVFEKKGDVVNWASE